jgi:hypothetical protein
LPTDLVCLDGVVAGGFGGLLAKSGQKQPDMLGIVHVAVVDLTGAKLKTRIRCWGAPIDKYGASVPKILGLYAAFQLRSDIRDLGSLQQ